MISVPAPHGVPLRCVAAPHLYVRNRGWSRHALDLAQSTRL